MVSRRASSGRGAGPATTDPSEIANREPWQGQMMVESAIRSTGQPWWVQCMSKPQKTPASGWVTTTDFEPMSTPPPIGTSAVATSGGPGLGDPDGDVVGLLVVRVGSGSGVRESRGLGWSGSPVDGSADGDGLCWPLGASLGGGAEPVAPVVAGRGLLVGFG